MGLLEDEAKVAELLELNGMPRWVAFEERFIVAEREGEVLARADRLHAAHPYEAGYHRWGGGWRMDLPRPFERREKLPAGGWPRRIALAGAFLAAFLVPKRQSRKFRT